MALTDNIISYWKFDETSGNAADSAGSNTLTNNNGVTYVSGKINNGANFVKTSSQSLSIANASQTGLSLNSDFTFSFWVKGGAALGAAPDSQFLFNKDSVSSNRSYGITRRTDVALNAGNPVVQTYLFASDATLMSTWWAHTIGTASFEHIVILCTLANPNATKLEMYVNNVSLGNGSNQQTGTVTAIQVGTAPFEIGTQALGSYFDGMIDEVGIWSRVLSSAEISTLYNGGSGLQYPFGGTTTQLPYRSLLGVGK